MARIELSGLAHSYKPNPSKPADWALKPMDLTWRQGGAYALLGPSGCGKTSLLNIISGLVAPSQGRVRFDDADVTALPTEKRNIAQVFQFPVIYDTMSVFDNLAFPLRNRGLAAGAIEARVREIAGLLDLGSDLSRRARGLSADAKQKVSLGRGLVREDVAAILFDEPLTVIDPALKWELRSKLKAMHRRFDITMIYVTHDQTEALTFADTVVVMHDGAVVQTGTPQDLFERPEHTFVGHFIGSPGMNLLPVTVNGDEARIGDMRLALGRAYPDLPAGGALELGIRPEHLSLVDEGAIRVTLERIDDLGRSRIARVRLGPHRLAATVSPEFRGSDTPALRFDAAQIHLYRDSRRIP